MSADSARLVVMANQIATAFDGQRGPAVFQTAEHIKAFWAGPMRRSIIAHLKAGGAAMSPTARAAIALLADDERLFGPAS